MTALRMVFITVSSLLLVGIWLTGFDKAHWLFYIPTAILMFAGLTGICPGTIFWHKMGFKCT